MGGGGRLGVGLRSGTYQPLIRRLFFALIAVGIILPAPGALAIPLEGRDSSPPTKFVIRISAVTAAELGHSWTPACPVGPQDLRRLTVTYRNMVGRDRVGSVIVHQSQAVPLANALEALYMSKYPIQSMTPIGELPIGAESEPRYNNTSVFHCRSAVGTNRWSEHAYGLALDLNPRLNPYVKGSSIEPFDAGAYLDRTLGLPGMITPNGEVVAIFASIGWEWGGYWRSLKDYHHFSLHNR